MQFAPEMGCTGALICPAPMPAGRAFAAGASWSLALQGKEELPSSSVTISQPPGTTLKLAWLVRGPPGYYPVMTTSLALRGRAGELYPWESVGLGVQKEPRIEDQALRDCHSHGTFSRKHSRTTTPDMRLPTRTLPNDDRASALSAPRAHKLGAHLLLLCNSVYHWFTGRFPFLLRNVFEAISTLVSLVWIYNLVGLQTSDSGPSNPLFRQMSLPYIRLSSWDSLIQQSSMAPSFLVQRSQCTIYSLPVHPRFHLFSAWLPATFIHTGKSMASIQSLPWVASPEILFSPDSLMLLYLIFPPTSQ